MCCHLFARFAGPSSMLPRSFGAQVPLFAPAPVRCRAVWHRVRDTLGIILLLAFVVFHWARLHVLPAMYTSAAPSLCWHRSRPQPPPQSQCQTVPCSVPSLSPCSLYDRFYHSSLIRGPVGPTPVDSLIGTHVTWPLGHVRCVPACVPPQCCQ